MAYASMRACALDLARAGHLLRIEAEVDPDLEMAEIHRRVFRAGGPALYFAHVRGCRFPMASNLFGTLERARFIFRDTLESVRRLVELRVDPAALWKKPSRYAGVPWTLLRTRPRKVAGGPLFANQIAASELPQLRSWPDDGGAFVTLPQVYTENPNKPGHRGSNLGMYRVQLSGGGYEKDREVGLHYQLHRGIGVHHRAALDRGEPLFVNIYVGGPPALTIAAMMPLPEGMPELAFAGALGGKRVRLADQKGWPLPICPDADFCILGEIHPGEMKPEGPFGDHLGYYSLRHDFPLLRVRRIYHRTDAVWPFTVVGRPPQEDSIFGELVHELTGPLIPAVLPGVLAIRAPAHAASPDGAATDVAAFCAAFSATDPLCAFPLVVLVDDSEFVARGLDNFLWVTFTRSNPAVDIAGIAAATVTKHWGCAGSLVIDARAKRHHAPPLVEDPAVTARVDRLFVKGGPLAGLGE